jgi:hypothetical protein
MPRTTQHTIYKATPQLAKERFYPCAQTVDEDSRSLMQSSSIFRRDEQHLGFSCSWREQMERASLAASAAFLKANGVTTEPLKSPAPSPVLEAAPIRELKNTECCLR